jgi:hypothetical protein
MRAAAYAACAFGRGDPAFAAADNPRAAMTVAAIVAIPGCIVPIIVALSVSSSKFPVEAGRLIAQRSAAAEFPIKGQRR